MKLWQLFVGWRIFLFVTVALAASVVAYRPNSEFTSLLFYARPSGHQAGVTILSAPVVWSWANFDGVHYLNIAGNGYTDQARFLPFYPALIGLVSRLLNQQTAFGLGQLGVALVLSNGAAIVSLVLFYKLLRLDYDEGVASLAPLLLLIYPSSFFLGSVYTESLFLVLCLGSFYCARRQRWGSAALLASLLMVTRLPGVMILPALLWEWWQWQRQVKPSVLDTSRSLIYLISAPLSIALYAWYNAQKWGNALYFITAHGELANGRATSNLVFPLQTVFRYLKMLLTVSPSTYEWWIAGLELACLGVVTGLLWLAWKKGVRKSYLVFGAGSILLPILSGTLTALPRYSLVVFSIFIGLALPKKREWLYLYAIICVPMLIALVVLFSRGYYVA